MRTIQVSKARTHLYSILDSVERGESVLITRNGKPIARIEPEPHRTEPREAAPKNVPQGLKPR